MVQSVLKMRNLSKISNILDESIHGHSNAKKQILKMDFRILQLLQKIKMEDTILNLTMSNENKNNKDYTLTFELK